MSPPAQPVAVHFSTGPKTIREIVVANTAEMLDSKTARARESVRVAHTPPSYVCSCRVMGERERSYRG